MAYAEQRLAICPRSGLVVTMGGWLLRIQGEDEDSAQRTRSRQPRTHFSFCTRKSPGIAIQIICLPLLLPSYRKVIILMAVRSVLVEESTTHHQSECDELHPGTRILVSVPRAPVGYIGIVCAVCIIPYPETQVKPRSATQALLFCVR